MTSWTPTILVFLTFLAAAMASSAGGAWFGERARIRRRLAEQPPLSESVALAEGAAAAAAALDATREAFTGDDAIAVDIAHLEAQMEVLRRRIYASLEAARSVPRFEAADMVLVHRSDLDELFDESLTEARALLTHSRARPRPGQREPLEHAE